MNIAKRVVGIYRIAIQRPDGSLAVYFGQSSNCHKRFIDHRKTLRGNRHDNPRLQHSFNKYGELSFIFTVLLVCQPDDLTFYEQTVINAYAGDEHLLNIRRECVSSSRGLRISNETKAKLSAARKGRKMGPHSEATKTKISAGNKGRERSPELRAAISAAQRGRKASNETRAKMSSAQKGRKMSDEARAKISASTIKRYTNPMERERARVAKLGNRYMVGKTIPPETRARMSEAAFRREAAKRTSRLNLDSNAI